MRLASLLHVHGVERNNKCSRGYEEQLRCNTMSDNVILTLEALIMYLTVTLCTYFLYEIWENILFRYNFYEYLFSCFLPC